MCGWWFDDDSNQKGDSLFSPGIQFSSIPANLPNLLSDPGFESGGGAQPVIAPTFTQNQTIYDLWYIDSAPSGAYNVTITARFGTNPQGNTGIFCLEWSLNTTGTMTDFIASQNIPNPSQYAGHPLTFSAWCRTTMTNVRIQLTDGVTTAQSPFFPSDGGWHSVSVTLNVSKTPGTIKASLGQFATPLQAGNMFFDSCMLVQGAVAQPFTAPGSSYPLVEPNVTSGCPFCGTYNPEGKLLNKNFGTDIDIANL